MEFLTQAASLFKSAVKAQKSKRYQGVDLTNIGLWFVIALVVIAGSIASFTYLSTKADAMVESQTIQNLASAARDTRTNKGYESDIVAQIIAASSYPANVVVANGKISNPWGGFYEIAANTTKTGFTLKATSVPAEDCIALVRSVPLGVFRSVDGKAIGSMNPKQIETDICGNSGTTDIVWSTDAV